MVVNSLRGRNCQTIKIRTRTCYLMIGHATTGSLTSIHAAYPLGDQGYCCLSYAHNRPIERDHEDRLLHRCLLGFGLCFRSGLQACLQVRLFMVKIMVIAMARSQSGDENVVASIFCTMSVSLSKTNSPSWNKMRILRD